MSSIDVDIWAILMGSQDVTPQEWTVLDLLESYGNLSKSHLAESVPLKGKLFRTCKFLIKIM